MDRYGEFCAIFKRSEVESYSSLIFVKHDSLRKYVNGDNNVDIAWLSQDISNKEHAHFLVAIKHDTNIENTANSEWSDMVCCNDCYIEAITLDNILDNHVLTVRIKQMIHDQLCNKDSVFGLLYGDIPKKSDVGYVFALYLAVRKLLEQKGINLEIL